MIKLNVYGNVPLARFGHTLTLVLKHKLLLFGGATGDTGKYSITDNTYLFDIPSSTWDKVQTTGTVPSPRAAHAACSIQSNQVVIYGGASGGGCFASDDLMLLDLKDSIGVWNTIRVVGQTPKKRYGHTMVFCKPYLIVFGGNINTITVNDCWVLNVQRAPISWQKIDTLNSPSARAYHAASTYNISASNRQMVVFGGRAAQPDSTALADTWTLKKTATGWQWQKVREPDSGQIGRHQHNIIFMENLMLVVGGRSSNVGQKLPFEVLDMSSNSWHVFQSLQRFRHGSCLVGKHLYIYGGFQLSETSKPTDSVIYINLTKILQPSQISPSKPTIQMSKTAPSALKQISTLNSKVTVSPLSSTKGKRPTYTIMPAQLGKKEEEKRGSTYQQKKIKESSIASVFLNLLMQPKLYISNPDGIKFPFRPQQIIALCEQVQNVIKNQPMVLKVKAPVKIFGDIHGQYSDLMSFFALYGCPFENGKDKDIEAFDYIFLGDFVDRGINSLQTICLLFALKVKYPKQIHLIRGNHEDKWINCSFGFSDQCIMKLNQDSNSPDSVFMRVNQVFQWLPLAAIVEQRILCLHGGIGSSLNNIEQIQKLPRPLEVIHEVTNLQEQLVVDILWSDPTDSDAQTGIIQNVMRDPQGTGNIVKFGPDRVHKFLAANQLQVIVRAHQCVMDGFQRFAGGALMTVFSATDYCGRHKNAGSILIISKDLVINAKLIYPQSMRTNTWIQDQQQLKKRPPTPPRWRGNGSRRSYQ